MTNESLLDALAHDSAVAIVERHGGDVCNRDALVEAIARLARLGLEGHVRLFELQQSESRAGGSRADIDERADMPKQERQTHSNEVLT